ncbi:MAG: DNA helicase PcrA [Eubacteriales bacterium]|nr:DNA helicase PcrA [Eubacteriales bacterium]
MRFDYSELNDEQRKAVLYGEGPLLILAGAGSGKTRVLTHRVVYLVEEKGVSPGSILAITFTNKAAGEMKSRINDMLGRQADEMWVGTFHSMCVRILRRDIEKTGYKRNFVIFDRQDQQTLVKECIKELSFDEKLLPPRTVLDYIGRAKDDMTGPEEYSAACGQDFRMKQIADIYILYQKKLRESNALDFDDIILKTIELLSKNPPVLSFYRDKFSYILVDEYQDTNLAQYKLVSMLTGTHSNLCVVGDDDQSIFSWRGANIGNILDFEKEFRNCGVIKLEQNYRSTSNILEAANSVIGNNSGRKAKRLWTENVKGEPVQRYEASTEHEEAAFVAACIRKSVGSGKSKYSDHAVLYRMNAMSRVLEEAFIREGIPYKIFGGLRFYDRKEIKDVLAYMRLVQNTSDNISFMRVINTPRRGIGNAAMEALSAAARDNGCSLFDAAATASAFEGLKRYRAALSSFTEMIFKLAEKAASAGIFDITEMILEGTGLRKELEKEETTEAKTRLENINELLSAAREFEAVAAAEGRPDSLEEFLAGVSLVADIDDMEEVPEYTALMTLHSAKGLEFPTVFIVGAEEGVFPGYRSAAEEPLLEEERRLCYVGMTRAMEKLYITNARQRMLFGNTTLNRPSRFIGEIPEKLLYNSSAGGNGRQITQQADQDFIWARSAEDFLKKGFAATADPGMLAPGDMKAGAGVEHVKFGKGKILKLTGSGKDSIVEVEFEGVGIRRMMTAYAKLKKL